MLKENRKATYVYFPIKINLTMEGDWLGRIIVLNTLKEILKAFLHIFGKDRSKIHHVRKIGPLNRIGQQEYLWPGYISIYTNISVSTIYLHNTYVHNSFLLYC